MLETLLLLLGVSAPPPPVAARLEVRCLLRSSEPLAAPLDGELELVAADRPSSRSAPDAEPLAVPLTLAPPGEARLEVELPVGGLYRLRARLAGIWSPPVVVEAGSDRRVAIDLYRTGTLRGSFSLPRGAVVEGPLEAAFEAEPLARRLRARRAVPAGAVGCAVEAAEGRGRFRCEVPAGELDLRFHRPGFASVHRWGVAVPAGGTVEVDPFELTPGASLTGFVVFEEGAPAAEGEVRVAVRPYARRHTGVIPGTRLTDLERSVAVDRRGFFQLADLAPGSYVVEARAAGFAPARRYPVRVLAGRESRLEQPLELARPVALEVLVQPPVDPAEGPWHLTLEPLEDVAGASLETIEGDTGPDGSWSPAGLAPGPYRLRVQSAFGRRWLQQEVEVERGGGPLWVEVPLVRVRGRVTLGGEPLRARIGFEGRSESSVWIYSDLEGSFEGTLPGEGTYLVSLRLRRRGADQVLEPVEVVREPGEPSAWLEIEVPDTHLSGIVVDGTGRPLARVIVLAWREGSERGTSTARTGEDGRFELRGLLEGVYHLSAVDPRLSGDSMVVDVREGRKAREVRLVLEESHELRGRVVSPQGPVAGAVVIAHPEAGFHRRVGIQSAMAGPDGTFRLPVPASAEAVWLIVFPPGFAARMLRVPAATDRPLVVPVSDFGGTLVLEAEPVSGGKGPFAPRPPRLGHGGVRVELPLFAQWAALHGQPRPAAGRWVLPMMEVGDYTFCSAGEDTCIGGSLSPNGELSLLLPRGEERAAAASPPSPPR